MVKTKINKIGKWLTAMFTLSAITATLTLSVVLAGVTFLIFAAIFYNTKTHDNTVKRHKVIERKSNGNSRRTAIVLDRVFRDGTT